MTAYKVSPAFRILVTRRLSPRSCFRDRHRLADFIHDIPHTLDVRDQGSNSSTYCRTSFRSSVLPNYVVLHYLRIICDGNLRILSKDPF
jgi:hypothetical protein